MKKGSAWYGPFFGLAFQVLHFAGEILAGGEGMGGSASGAAAGWVPMRAA